MRSKIEKTVPLLALSLILLIMSMGLAVVIEEIMAADIQSQVSVGNAAPTVATVTLNSGDAITLVANGTTTVLGTTTITDSNGWVDISHATATLFQNGNSSSCSTGVGGAGRGAWCYWMASSSCTLGATTTSSRIVSCSAFVWFIGEPTTGTSTITGDWQMDITAYDGAASTSYASSGANSVECNVLYALNASSSIDYGSVAPGATSSEQTTKITNTGNWQIDNSLSGVDMDDGSVHTIPVGQQKYSSSSDMGDWVGTALTTSAAAYDLELPRPTATTSNSTDNLYWMIKIPDGQYAATYTGTNTLTARDAL